MTKARNILCVKDRIKSWDVEGGVRDFFLGVVGVLLSCIAYTQHPTTACCFFGKTNKGKREINGIRLFGKDQQWQKPYVG